MYKPCAASKQLRVLRFDAFGVCFDVVDEIGAGVVAACVGDVDR